MRNGKPSMEIICSECGKSCIIVPHPTAWNSLEGYPEPFVCEECLKKRKKGGEK